MSGFAFLAAFALLFTAFIASDIELFTVEDDYIATSQDARIGEYDRISDYLHANITITKLTYSSGSGTVYVENSGGIVLDPDYVDFMLDGELFAEEDVQVSMSNEWWEPGEGLTISFTKTLEGGYHEVKVTAGEGVYAVLRFYFAVGGAMMTYYDESWARQVPRFRSWNDSAWSNENGAGAIDGSTNIDIQWFVLRAAPIRDEYILGTLDSEGDVNVQVWQNGSWLGVLEVEDAITTGNDDRRGFDIAYEQLSGRAIIVYQDDTVIPKYRIWDGTQWSSEYSVAGIGSSVPVWIVLASNPNSNEIVLATLDTAKDIWAQVWDGTSWGNNEPMETNAEDWKYQCFDVAYEYGTERALLVYSDNSDTPQYRIWNGISWSAEGSASTIDSDRIRWIKLASDPSSDRILMGILDDDKDVNVEMWNGNFWETAVRVEDRVDKSDRRLFDVAFEGSTSRAMIVLGDRNDKTPDYYICDAATVNCDVGGDWTSGNANDVGDNSEWIVLEPDPFSNDIMMMVKDKGKDISVQRWDTAAWLVDPGAAIGAGGEVEDDSDNNFESFAIAYALFIDRGM